MINISNITDKQKLIIEKGLCDYNYIMTHCHLRNIDFESVFYEFYLKARWAVMNKPENKNPYFNELYSISINIPFMTILEDLKESMGAHSYEFSLGSKLLHTIDSTKPIYDSKVRIYLSSEEDVDFWWSNKPKDKVSAKGKSEREKIEHDWNELNNWYENFLVSSRGMEWIEWFDLNFPTFKSISNVKKIDFIIFATR